MSAAGKFVWFDLMTTDVEKSLVFLGEMFGLKVDQTSGGDGDEDSVPYFTVGKEGVAQFGAVPIEGDDEMRSHWIPFLAVSDVDAVCSFVQEAGGEVHVPPAEPGEGAEDGGAGGATRVAICTDPLGAVFAPCEPGAESKSATAGAGVGQIVRVEMATVELTGAANFYAEFTGWKVQGSGDTVSLQGQSADVGEIPLSGLLSGSPIGPHWLMTFLVADLDAAVARAEALGGFIYDDPRDVSGGRRAIIIEPSGALIGLWQRA